jgi:hypothetical protein
MQISQLKGLTKAQLKRSAMVLIAFKNRLIDSVSFARVVTAAEVVPSSAAKSLILLAVSATNS